MIQRILICGCARSGNTLMLNLMEVGFQNIVKNIDGPGNEQIPKKPIPGHVVVGKFPKKIYQLDTLMKPDLGVIYMLRDARDVLISKHFQKPHKYWTPIRRWVEAAEIAVKYENHPQVHILKFEDLLRSPDKIQFSLAQKFGLIPLRSFAAAHKYFDKTDDYNIQTMNGIRPLDKSRIGAWKTKRAAAKRFMENEDVQKYMRHFGYLA